MVLEMTKYKGPLIKNRYCFLSKCSEWEAMFDIFISHQISMHASTVFSYITVLKNILYASKDANTKFPYLRRAKSLQSQTWLAVGRRPTLTIMKRHWTLIEEVLSF